MTEMMPSGDGDYSGSDSELYGTDFTQWEQELTYEDDVGEAGELGHLALIHTIDYDGPVSEFIDDELPVELTKIGISDKNDIRLQPERGSRNLEPGITQDELFSAAMGLIYFTTGIPADTVFDE